MTNKKTRAKKLSKKNQEQIMTTMEYGLVAFLVILFILVYVSRGGLI